MFCIDWYEYRKNHPDTGIPIFGGSATSALRYRLPAWVITGVMTGFGVYLGRLIWFLALRLRERFESGSPRFWRFQMSLRHSRAFTITRSAGFVRLLAAAVWHTLSYQIIGDFYVATAIGFLVMGLCFGSLTWAVPPDLYLGWVRVLSAHRYGHRIPVLGPDEAFSERFVGHFPRGLDVFVEHEHGVAEIHASFVGEASGRYAVRGLSQSPTYIMRFIERLDLTYDARSPVPLESDLNMEDVVVMKQVVALPTLNSSCCRRTKTNDGASSYSSTVDVGRRAISCGSVPMPENSTTRVSVASRADTVTGMDLTVMDSRDACIAKLMPNPDDYDKREFGSYDEQLQACLPSINRSW